MKITKMHALGNNYIYINTLDTPLKEDTLSDLAVRLSDVRRGIGADGMILIGSSDTADVDMRIFNADGSEAETCGNGLRCVAKYVFDRDLVNGSQFTIHTKAGVVKAEVHHGALRQTSLVTIDMGEPKFGPAALSFAGPAEALFDHGAKAKVPVDDAVFAGTLVSMGNPHFVIRVDDAKTTDVGRVGPVIERHAYFPERVNVEFVTPIGREELDFRVWERGSGITYACGTGACAAVVAGIREDWLDEAVTVHLLGGDLRIAQQNGRVLMAGEAVEVFEGEYHL